MNERKVLSDIADSLVEKHNMDKKDAELFVKNMFELIKETLSTEKYVKIKGLGTFKLTEVDARESVDINTGERIEIQGHVKVTFTPDTSMKELINKPFSHFETVVLNDGVKLEDVLPEEELEQEIREESVEIPSVVEEVMIEEQVNTTESELLEVELQEEVVQEDACVAETEGQLPMDVKQEEQFVEEIIDVPQSEIFVDEEIEQVPVEVEDEIAPVEVAAVAAAAVAAAAAAEEEEEEEEEEEKVSENSPEKVTEVQEAVQEDVQPESVVSTEVVAPINKENRTIRILWGVIVVLVLVILFGCYWMFMRSDSSSDTTPVSFVQEGRMVEKPVSEEVKEDSLEVDIKSEGVVPEEKTEIGIVPMTLPKSNRVASLADTLDYRIVGTKTTYTLQSGESIIKASVKFFGSKMFWPYIVKHNRDVIANPDDIPIGTQIKIPELVPNN